MERKMLGYMLTWTTYGSWLPGDERGYVQDGEVLKANPRLERQNRTLLKEKPVRLNPSSLQVVRGAIVEESRKLGQTIYAMAICPFHVHLVVNDIPMAIGFVVSHYKNASRLAMRIEGYSGKLWTRGYDKRYCFDEKELNNRIAYVRRHNHEEGPTM